MRELIQLYRALPGLARVAIAGALVLAAIALIGNVPNLLTAILVAGAVLLALGAVLAVLGVISLPFVGICLAVYGLVKALRSVSQPPSLASPTNVPQLAGGLPPAPPPDLPTGIAAREARVRDKADALRSPGQAVFLTVDDQQHVDRTLNEYLPKPKQMIRNQRGGDIRLGRVSEA